MAKTPEKRVKDKVTKQLKLLGAYYFYPFSMGYGNSGVPDIICCYLGYFVAIECKSGKNTTTKLQDINLDNIKQQGGLALVINEENVDQVTELITSYCK